MVVPHPAGTRDADEPSDTDSEDDSGSSSNQKQEHEGYDDEEEPPKPVSSESEPEDPDSDDDSEDYEGVARQAQPSSSSASQRRRKGTSRLFAPYRTLGMVSSGRPFHLVPHENSQSHLLCIPIGDRFQLVRTDKLQPVLVSQTVPVPTTTPLFRRRHNRRTSNATGLNASSTTSPKVISHCVSDSALRISVIVHHGGSDASSTSSSPHVTLYHRTSPLCTRSIVVSSVPSPPARGRRTTTNRRHNHHHHHNDNRWDVTGLLHLGRVPVAMTGEKEGQLENVVVVAVILTQRETEEERHVNVPVVGDNDDDDDDDDNESIGSATNQEEEEEDEPLDQGLQQDTCRGQVVIFLASRSTLTVQRRIRLSTLPSFRPLTSVHPATYLNKIVLGGHDSNGGQGRLVLLNVRSSKVVHVFACLPPDCPSITALEQSPAVDTIAVGTESGNVHLINLRVDATLFTLRHPSAVASLSFRTDGSALRYGIAPLAVGRADGTVTIWDLSPPPDDDDESNNYGRQILCELKNCHPGGVAKLQYLPQEPLLVSIGSTSNSILMHIFDSPNHTGRILKQRKGHTSPPSLIRYWHGPSGVHIHDGTDASACQIVSTGPDRTLRIFSSARSVLDKEFSQGPGLEKRAKKLGMDTSLELRLPPIHDMALCDARSRDWGDLVTIHERHAFAYVWSTKRGAQSGPLLRQPTWNISAMKVPPPPKEHATSVTMSVCGNFALVGTQGGTIYKYNVQSGNPRGSYPRNDAAAEDDDSTAADRARKRTPGHVSRTLEALAKSSEISNRSSNLDEKARTAEQTAKIERQIQAKLALASHLGAAVTGLAVDSVNRSVVSVGADKKLILWNFTTHAPHSKSPFYLPSAATKMRHIRESDLAAIALQDFSVVLFDCASLSIVRRFGVGSSRHTGPISDLVFGPDGRTLFTASLDGTIRVYDVPTSSCVEWLSFESPPTSLTISPTGEFLATTHVGKVGIHMWSDRSYYQTVHSYGVPLTEPVSLDDPVPMTESQDHADALTNTSDTPPHNLLDNQSARQQTADEIVVPKQDGLVTLSGLPQTHWKTLFHLDLIRERNKPLEPPKKPPTAPFFLQWRGGESIGEQPATEVAHDGNGGEDEEWAAAWSDGEDDGLTNDSQELTMQSVRADGGGDRSRSVALVQAKRRKVTHHRSHLASLLQRTTVESIPIAAKEISNYVATIGPSAIDVALSSLCTGIHDLEEGIPLLLSAWSWLTEACNTRERFEVTNAYLHRFLYLHGPLLAQLSDEVRKDDRGERRFDHADGISQLLLSIERLKEAQSAAAEALNVKVQHSLCLLRHLSRMV